MFNIEIHLAQIYIFGCLGGSADHSEYLNWTRGRPSELRVPIGSRSRPLQEVKLNVFPNAFWNWSSCDFILDLTGLCNTIREAQEVWAKFLSDLRDSDTSKNAYESRFWISHLKFSQSEIYGRDNRLGIHLTYRGCATLFTKLRRFQNIPSRI